MIIWIDINYAPKYPKQFLNYPQTAKILYIRELFVRYVVLSRENEILPKIEGFTMIKPTTPDDTDAVLALAQKLEMFDSDGLELIKASLADYFSGNSNDHWFSADENGLVGVIYCAPEAMTNGTWNVLMLLVDRDRQRQGYGSALISYVEQTLRDRGERLLIVETSSLDEFEPARQFYSKCGFKEEARIQDFYAAGEDKIVFTKALSAS